MTAAMLALALALVVTAAAAPTRSTFNEADMPIHLVDEVTRCGAAKVSVQRSPPFPPSHLMSSTVIKGARPTSTSLATPSASATHPAATHPFEF
jgi:hypothetical protein